jgi:hypothetical protein
MVLLFCSTMTTDALYVLYNHYLVAGHAARAATASVLYHGVTAFSVVAYIYDWRYILPVLAGSWVGTFVTVRYKKRLAL